MQIAAAVSPQELKIAADYFARPDYRKWIRVVETDMVPKFEISSHNMLVKAPGGGHGTAGRRASWKCRKIWIAPNCAIPASGFVAYVPKGAIARGKKLVDSRQHGAFPCAVLPWRAPEGRRQCAGAGGAFAQSGIVRQLYDFKHGTRGGPAADPMKPEVAHMTDEQRLDIAAYLASLNP